MPTMTPSERFLRLRHSLGWSRAKLALRLGCSTRGVSHVEDGDYLTLSTPLLTALRRLESIYADELTRTLDDSRSATPHRPQIRGEVARMDALDQTSHERRPFPRTLRGLPQPPPRPSPSVPRASDRNESDPPPPARRSTIDRAGNADETVQVHTEPRTTEATCRQVTNS